MSFMIVMLVLIVGAKLVIYLYGSKKEKLSAWGREVDQNAKVWFFGCLFLMILIPICVCGFQIIRIYEENGYYWFDLTGLITDSWSFDYLVQTLSSEKNKTIWSLSERGLITLCLISIEGWCFAFITILGLRRRKPSMQKFILAIISLTEMIAPALLLMIWITQANGSFSFVFDGVVNKGHIEFSLTKAFWFAILTTLIIFFMVIKRRIQIMQVSEPVKCFEHKEEKIEESSKPSDYKLKINMGKRTYNSTPDNVYLILRNEVGKGYMCRCPYCDGEMEEGLQKCSICGGIQR